MNELLAGGRTVSMKDRDPSQAVLAADTGCFVVMGFFSFLVAETKKEHARIEESPVRGLARTGLLPCQEAVGAALPWGSPRNTPQQEASGYRPVWQGVAVSLCLHPAEASNSSIAAFCLFQQPAPGRDSEDCGC